MYFPGGLGGWVGGAETRGAAHTWCSPQCVPLWVHPGLHHLLTCDPPPRGGPRGHGPATRVSLEGTMGAQWQSVWGEGKRHVHDRDIECIDLKGMYLMGD